MIDDSFIPNKLANFGTTIFSVMSNLAQANNAINLAQGFPNFGCDDKLVQLVTKYMRAGKNQYAPMPGVDVLRDAIAGKIKRTADVDLNPDTEITVTAGATQAIQIVTSALLQSGDEVIQFDPSYDSYAPCVTLCGAKTKHVVLSKPNFEIDWIQVKKLISARTRLIIINTPHNPTGRIFTNEDFIELERIISDRDILVLSDEVYEHITFDGQKHISILEYPALASKSICVSSFGKTFHTTGWKIGYMVAPALITQRLRKVFQYAMFSVSTPMQYAIGEYLKEETNYTTLNSFYEQKRNLFMNSIKHSKFKLLPCEGTYFQCVDYSEISDHKDTEFAIELTEKYKIAAIPISVFYKESIDERIVRFCFAKTNDVLNKASEILCKI